MGVKRRSVLVVAGTSIAVSGCLGDGDDTGETTAQNGGTDTDGSETEDTTEDDDGSNDTAGDEKSEDTTEGDGESEAVTVQVRAHPEFGDILVGPDEMTLYKFDTDTQGEQESACYDDCAEAWPALTVEGTPTAGTDVTAELTTFERDDGTTQMMANGWPLYYFATDEEPGDTKGQGVDEVWWVLRSDGTPIRNDDEGTGGDDTDGDDGPGGAYSY